MDNFDFTKFYDQQHDYESFRNDPEKRHEYDIAVNWKVKNLGSLTSGSIKFSNILEIGCALGILLNKMADSLSIKERTGVDISTENIKIAKQLFPECTFFQGTIENTKKKFDLVILSDIVEHIPDDLDFMKKVSKISNYVLFNLPLEKSFMNKNRKYGVDDPSGHLRKYNKYDAAKLARSSGFKILSSFTVNSHYNKEHFELYRKNRNQRIGKKGLIKKVFWTLFYLKMDAIRFLMPWLYIKIYGSNYFALLKVSPE